MRPVHLLAGLLLLLAMLAGGLALQAAHEHGRGRDRALLLATAASGFGLTDLCIATEARYTRHPAVSDRTVPFMDHPGALEHFPTGSFWAPPPFLSSR